MKAHVLAGLGRQALVKIDRVLVQLADGVTHVEERQQTGRMPGRAGCQLGALQQHHIRPPLLRKVVQGTDSDHAPADHHHARMSFHVRKCSRRRAMGSSKSDSLMSELDMRAVANGYSCAVNSAAAPRKSKYAFLTLPHYSLIALANAVEPLRMANRVTGQDLYEWSIVSLDGRPVQASSGLDLTPTVALDKLGKADILFVCGGVNVREAVTAPLAHGAAPAVGSWHRARRTCAPAVMRLPALGCSTIFAPPFTGRISRHCARSFRACS